MYAVDLRGHLAEVAARPNAPAGGAAERLVVRADAICVETPLREAIDIFRRFPDVRYLAVVDRRQRPLGAINERAIRNLLFSPFGHALLANPGCRWTLQGLVTPCAAVERSSPVDAMVAAYDRTPEAEGLILVEGGRYAALLPGPALLQLAAARQRAEVEAAQARSAELESAFARFRADFVALAEALAAAAGEIRASAHGVSDRARRNGELAMTVAAAAVQSSASIGEVAASSAELAGQVLRIEERVAEAMRAFDAAAVHVARGTANARSLSGAADHIGSVVGLIAAIAAKVNMLAINATIEAARAGPAGRSFAVVAGEVKTLAGQTAAAAREIDERIASVRAAVAENSATNASVEAVVRDLARIAADISGSVAEQSSATRLIAANVDQAAQGSAQISGLIDNISERAATAGGMAERLGQVAEDLAARAHGLGERVELFLGEVRAA